MQASKQMIETGDYVSIRFQDDPRTKKPVGIHWLQTLSINYLAGGDATAWWAYRLPSALCAWLAVLLTYGAGRRLSDSRTGLISAGLLACTLITVVEAHLAKTDAALLLTVVLAHLALLEFYLAPQDHGPPFPYVLVFWTAIGAGLLIKGPIIVAVVVATVAGLWVADRNAAWLRALQPAIGVPIAMACVLPWLIATAMMGQGGVVLASLSEDFLPKILGGQEGHGAWPGTYTLLAPALLWPASLIVLPGVIRAWEDRHLPGVRFALAWSFAPWLMFELVPTKLPHYILPAVPGLVIASSLALSKMDFSVPQWSKILWGTVALALASVLVWASWSYGGSRLIAGSLAALLVVTAALTWTRQSHLQMLIPVHAVVIFGIVFATLLPSMSDLTLSTRLAASVERLGGGLIAVSQYHEPSLVFHVGTGTRLTNWQGAAAHVTANPGALAIIATNEFAAADDQVAAQGGSLAILDRITGYNYSKGRPENLAIIRNTPAQP